MVVLIADNDVAVNSLLADVLRSRGLACESAHDGEQALARIRRGGVTVLVTDLDMPNLDGCGLLVRLVAEASPPRTIVVSGYLDEDVRRSLRALPVVRGVLAKPFDVVAFADLVRRVAGDAATEGGME